MTPDVVSGCAFLDKSPGDSSFAALYAVKRAFNTRKVGHTGTLDPFASGLLVALVGRATRAAQFITGLDKTYIASISFGSETDTGDCTGTTIREAHVPGESDVRNALKNFVGPIEQVPPAFSAVHVDGRRAYKLARQGVALELAPRQVVVHEFSVLTWLESGFSAVISCSSGTYIRSLARDLGRKVGSAAHLEQLRRTRIGPFVVDEATVPDAFHPNNLVDVGEALLRIPGTRCVDTTEAQARRVRQGGELRSSDVASQLGDDRLEGSTLIVVRNRGRTIALASWSGERLAYYAVLEVESHA